jgi:hypothetical protein
MAQKSRAERSNGVALIASFFVIAFGLAGTIVVCTISAPDPKYAIPAAVGVFLLIALLPINAMRERNRDPMRQYVKGPSLFRRFKDWAFSGNSGDDQPEPRTWKRRKPSKSSQASVFVPDGAEIRPPTMG